MRVLEAKDIVKEFGGLKALDRVTISVDKGDFFGFFGPNGAGKSTLIRILTGQLEPTSGSVDVLGVDVNKEPLKVKELIGIVPEVESPPSYLTGYEYLYFVGKVRNLDKLEDRIEKWVSFFDLESKKGTIAKACPRACARRSCSRARSSTSRSCCSWTSRSSTWTRSTSAS